MYSSNKFVADWQAAQPDDIDRKTNGWNDLKLIMQKYYNPTENLPLKNFHFRSLIQDTKETFLAFCNRVQREAKQCQLKCKQTDCSAEETAVRDQIVIGTHENNIREEAMKKLWDLKTLREEGMKMDSAVRGGAEISSESSLNKLGRYSFSKMKKNKQDSYNGEPKTITCYNCGSKIKGTVAKHREKCPAKNSRCRNFSKMGNFAKVCLSKNVRETTEEKKTDMEEVKESTYNINLFRFKSFYTTVIPKLSTKNNDFKVEVIVKNNLTSVIVDTGAKISVCGTPEANKWNLLSRMVPSKVKIKRYSSIPTPIHGEARCAISFGKSSLPDVWHIISGYCETILSGSAVQKLGIIQLNSTSETFQPISMIEDCKSQELYNCLARYLENFSGLGKLKNYIKPVSVQQRSIPYHLKIQADQALNKMIKDGVIKLHPEDKPAPWISNIVIAPKPDRNIRIKVDARNLNKAIMSKNLPIPRHENIKPKLAGCEIFSKMDFKSVFWQIEIEDESRCLTVFYANDELY